MALTTNLVAYYKLDGNSSESISAQNGHDTSITYSSGNGKINQGAGFDGSSSYIYLPDTAKGGNSMSVSLWFYITNPSFTGENLYCESLDAYFNLHLVAGGGIGINHGTSGSGYNVYSSATGLFSDHQWVHVVGTYDSGTGTLKVYVNGTAVITQSESGNQLYGNGAPNQANDNVLGCYAYFNGTLRSGYFPGNIDEVGIWSRALSGAEVTSLYNTGTGTSYPFLPAGTLATFSVTDTSGNPITSQNVNTPFNVKVTALDSFGTLVPSFTGTVDLTSTSSIFSGGGTTGSFTAGVLASRVIALSDTGSQTITATNHAGSESGTSNSFTILNVYPIEQNVGNIYTPVKLISTLSNVRHINIFMAQNASVSGTQKEAQLDFYFNGSSTSSMTKYVTRDDIRKGYISIELNKPYANSMQIRTRYFNSSNLNPEGLYSYIGVADYAPSYAELFYEPTTTIR